MKRLHIIIFLLIVSFVATRCQKNKLVEGDPMKLSFVVTDVSSYGGSDGKINLTVKGGIKPYGFFWSNGEITEDIDSLIAGDYIIIVTDKQHQIISDTVEVIQPTPVSLVMKYEINYPSTNDGNDGSINLTVSGGYPPYSYSWSNGSESEDISGLSADIYVITVTDSLAQSVTDTISLRDFVVDVDGNSYGTVTIGSQTWMKQNLRVTHSAGGDEIESYIYKNIDSLVNSYGRLYSWDAAMNGSTDEGAQGICPDGWHVPTDEEVKTLEMALGMSREEADLGNVWRGSGVGTKLKFGGSSGFDALLSGRRVDDGTYSYIDRFEYLWTSTQSGSDKVWRRTLDKMDDAVGRFDTTPKSYGLSVRCIKNDN